MRRSILISLLAVGATVGAVACGSDDDAAFTTLPPIETTTTTSTTTTTVSTERIFYEIKPGESLAIIAEQAGVTVQSIVDLNDSIENPDNIQAGQTIEIPRGQIVTELPGAPAAEPADDADGEPADDDDGTGDDGED
jgi:LysM repeat protein